MKILTRRKRQKFRSRFFKKVNRLEKQKQRLKKNVRKFTDTPKGKMLKLQCEKRRAKNKVARASRKRNRK